MDVKFKTQAHGILHNNALIYMPHCVNEHDASLALWYITEFYVYIPSYHIIARIIITLGILVRNFSCTRKLMPGSIRAHWHQVFAGALNNYQNVINEKCFWVDGYWIQIQMQISRHACMSHLWMRCGCRTSNIDTQWHNADGFLAKMTSMHFFPKIAQKLNI